MFQLEPAWQLGVGTGTLLSRLGRRCLPGLLPEACANPAWRSCPLSLCCCSLSQPYRPAQRLHLSGCPPCWSLSQHVWPLVVEKPSPQLLPSGTASVDIPLPRQLFSDITAYPPHLPLCCRLVTPFTLPWCLREQPIRKTQPHTELYPCEQTAWFA